MNRNGWVGSPFELYCNRDTRPGPSSGLYIMSGIPLGEKTLHSLRREIAVAQCLYGY